MSDIEQKLREDVARAWASIDGKVDQFDLEKNNPNLAYDDPAYVGSYEGYMAEANELLKRSGVGPLIASLRAKLESALTASRAECEGLRAAVGKVADHYEKTWGYDDDLRRGVGMQTVGQVVAADIRAALSQKETGDAT